MMQPGAGDLVQSRAGHDRGQYFVVVSVREESGAVWIADGKGRRVADPKRKNPRHLHMVRRAVLTGAQLTDSCVRRTIGAYVQSIQ
ncbi:MAG: KOW domain-containing RNA-binding protein [Eubacteriales bacterium]